MRERRYQLPLLMSMVILACSGVESSVPEPETEAFFASYNAGQYGRLFDDATQELRDTTTRARFVSFLAAAKARLGDYSSAGPCTTSRELGTRGRYVAQDCHVEFVDGSGTVQLAWKQVDGNLRLYRVNISSPDLMPPIASDSEPAPE